MEVVGENNSSKLLKDLHGITQLAELELEIWTFIPGSASYTLPHKFNSVSAMCYRELYWHSPLTCIFLLGYVPNSSKKKKKDENMFWRKGNF